MHVVCLTQCCNDKTLGILSHYHTIFTYIICFQLHSVAEDKSVEVGMLEDLIEGSFILNFKYKFRYNPLIKSQFHQTVLSAKESKCLTKRNKKSFDFSNYK